MPPTPAAERIPKNLPLLMSVACALSVANLYYNQPMLSLIARSFGVSEAQVGVIPTLSQVGYALGLGFLVPMGDIRERRGLILVLLGCVTVALLAAAFALTLPLLAFASLLIGVTTVVPQMLLPFAVHLSPPDTRGKTIGTVMSGLLLGILLSRTVAGFVGAAWGWRAMFGIAAALMVLLALVLRLLLPQSLPDTATQPLSYGGLLRSVLSLAREQPVLREAALVGALLFGAFSTFWATLVFHLSSPSFALGSHASRVAGLFGLVGAVGALAAPLIGRQADNRNPRTLIGAGAAITLLSFGIFAGWGRFLGGLIAGVILLDLGVQAAQVANQTRVYRLLPNAASRLNTVYMVSYFIGGSAGSFLGALGWSVAGWRGVCAVGALLSAGALLAQGWAVVRAKT